MRRATGRRHAQVLLDDAMMIRSVADVDLLALDQAL
jgi:hypothetical protein